MIVLLSVPPHLIRSMYTVLLLRLNTIQDITDSGVSK